MSLSLDFSLRHLFCGDLMASQIDLDLRNTYMYVPYVYAWKVQLLHVRIPSAWHRRHLEQTAAARQANAHGLPGLPCSNARTSAQWSFDREFLLQATRPDEGHASSNGPFKQVSAKRPMCRARTQGVGSSESKSAYENTGVVCYPSTVV